jgi:mercuric ion transport protein
MAASRWGHLATIASLALAMAPKCPVCLLAYAGFLGGLVSTSWADAYPGVLSFVMAASLALTVGALAWRADERQGYGPSGLALLGAISLLLAKFHFDSPPAVVAGMTAILAAAAWNSWRTAPHPQSCKHCSRLETFSPNAVKHGG